MAKKYNSIQQNMIRLIRISFNLVNDILKYLFDKSYIAIFKYVLKIHGNVKAVFVQHLINKLIENFRNIESHAPL